jgi:hypothetical protein
MKTISANLLDSTTTTYGDTSKTYLAGRSFQKTINSTPVVGPPLTNFIDVFTDTLGGGSVTPNGVYDSPNGRTFVAVTPAAGAMTILLYDRDLTGQTAPAYVGRIVLAVPNAAATTHTLRQFEVYDGPNAGTVTGWKIIFSTVGTVLINGGTFVANNISKSQFVTTSPPTIGMAISSSANAVYMLQDPGNVGVNNNITAIQGGGLDRSGLFNYVNNNVLATTQFIKWDLNATFTWVSQTTTAATSIGSPTFTLTAHGYNNNDPVVLITNVPGGFTATTTTAQTVYFVRNSAANTFELSATSGGASINATTVTSSTVIGRAFGTITTPWTTTKTGTVTGITGTILLTQTHMLVTPSTSLDPNIPAGLNGQLCYFLPTSSFFHLFKVSDITNGATSFPSMSAVNVLGTGVDYTGITAAQAGYSQATGRVIYTSNTSAFYAKKWLSSSVELAFGGLNTTYWENTPSRLTTNFSAVAITAMSLNTGQGWIMFGSSTVGQRGLYYMDLKSHYSFDYSYLISPLLDTSRTQFFEFLQTIEELFDYTNSMVFSYRTALTDTDPLFSSAAGGWTVLDNNVLQESNLLSNYTQVKIAFEIASLTAQTPAQVNELFISLTGANEISENWEGSVDNTTQNSGSPAKSAFRLMKTYAASVPTLYFRAYDDSGNLVISKNTATHASEFSYSTNNGSSWNPLGTIPNTAFTTELRYNWSTPPGVNVTVSLREA